VGSLGGFGDEFLHDHIHHGTGGESQQVRKGHAENAGQQQNGHGSDGFHHAAQGANEERLTYADLPYAAAMVVLDIAAPILMMYGLRINSAANTALLNNFEIVATIVMAAGCWLAGR